MPKQSNRPHTNQAAIYCRVSTTRQEEEGTSLDTQEARCRQYAVAHGFLIAEAHVYREVHTGTELWDRPLLTQLRHAIRQGDITVVLAYAIDRLSRDPVHLGVILSEAEHHHVQVEFVSEPIDNTPEGQLIRFVRGYAAKVESEKIRERVLRAKRSRAEQGKLHNWGRELYGYRKDKQAGIRVLYEPEAVIIQLVFRWYVDDKLGIRTIARRLNAQGIPAPSDGKVTYTDPTRLPRWGQGQVRRILTEPSYKGEAIAWRYTEGGRLRPESEWLPLPEGITPQVVSPELWARAHQRRETNTGAEGRNAIRPYLLRGHLRCTVCGLPMRTSPERGRRTYRCASRETPRGACGGKRVPADRVETWVWEQITTYFQDPQQIAEEVQRLRERRPQPSLLADHAAATRHLATLEKKQARLLRAFEDETDDDLPWDLFKRELRQIEQEKVALQKKLVQLTTHVEQQEVALQKLETLTTYRETVAHNLATYSFDEKRTFFDLLELVVSASGFKPEGWSIDGSIPFEQASGTMNQISGDYGHRARFAFHLPLTTRDAA